MENLMPGNQPKIQVSPQTGMLTDKYTIKANGFSPGSKVRLSSELVDESGIKWIAHGEFVADAAGEVNVDDAPSEKGTFSGLNPGGLFWSMRPEAGTSRDFMINGDNKNHMRGQPNFDPLAAQTITLRAHNDAEGNAATDVTLKRLADGVESFPVSEGHLRGIAFRQKDRSKSRGAIMSLTGSGGGVEMSYAPALAAEGYDVFSLAYFAYEGVSDFLFNIPLEYFEEGFEWMMREFGAKKMAVQGASRGGELSAILAAYLPHYVSGAIPIVPMYAASSGWNHVTGETGPSWTYKGKEIPYAKTLDTLSMEEMKKLGDELPNGYPCGPSYYEDMNQDYVRKDCTIPVERAAGAILMISAEEDQMWPCTWGSNMMIDRLRTKGFQHAYKHLALRETGHWTPLPNTVTTFTPAVYHSLAEVFLDCGGTPQGTGRTAWTMWNEMKAHYERVFANQEACRAGGKNDLQSL
jgi:acyl-coenzyme A thioesterase 1/2/4